MSAQKIGRYEVIGELGRGGMATVYRAYDPLFERDVAIKVLPHELLHDPQFRIRFEREAKTVAALEHPAIVPVYDVGEQDGQPYFVMRCMAGGSLEDLITAGRMNLHEAARIIAQVAPALDEAHRKGIIHRDLKPGNILFDRGGDAYITDFGIAKMTFSKSVTLTLGAVVGTPAYMSPEQAQGNPVDGRSDVYALGVIIYEMLSGVQPYQATTPMGVAIKQINQPIPHILDTISGLPPGIEAVIEKAMAKDPAERYASVGELSQALSAVAAAQTDEPSAHAAAVTLIAPARPPAADARTTNPPISLQAAQTAQPRPGLALPLLLAGGLLGACLLVLALALIFKVCPQAGALPLPWCARPAASLPEPTQPTRPIASTLTLTPLLAPISQPSPQPAPTLLPASATPIQVSAASLVPPIEPSLGGADRVAFVASKEIWLMNLDGSNLRVLTSDKLPKTNLQWIPGTDRLVFISGTTVKSLDTANGQLETLVSFPFAQYLDEFRLSPDGRQVAISLNREMYIVPFDTSRLKSVNGRDGLIAMHGCLSYTGSTLAAIHLKALRWAPDGKTVAWLFEGSGAGGRPEDLVRVTDISTCDPARLRTADEFPGSRFTPEGYTRTPLLPGFDWDGGYLFLLNTFDRNNGWGFLYTYSSEMHQAEQENPIASTNSHCCYRDARWSPDGSYIFFAFQNKDLAASPEQFYYVPASSIRAGLPLVPIPMPDGFFADPREAPQPALHPAQ